MNLAVEYTLNQNAFDVGRLFRSAEPASSTVLKALFVEPKDASDAGPPNAGEHAGVSKLAGIQIQNALGT